MKPKTMSKEQKIKAANLSQVGKLDGIYSWSLLAGIHCPGKIGELKGSIAAVCAGCYAWDRGNYRYPSVRAPREFNAQDWPSPDWVDRMVQAIDLLPFFRWFDSGDVYHYRLAEKMLEVMERTPDTRHWLPTRMAKFPKFAAILTRMDSLPNVKVRFSSDSIDGQFDAVHGSTVIDTAKPAPRGVSVCHAYISESDAAKYGKKAIPKCHGCRACWDKDVAVIAYKGHGQAMAKAQQNNRFTLGLVA